MISNQMVNVKFFLDGRPYAARGWFHVPRVGDEVMLKAPKGEKGDAAGKMAFKVLRVVWGVEAEGDRMQSANVALERMQT